MKIVLKIGYDGTKFYGFSRQPTVRTIEGDLRENLFTILGETRYQDLQFQYASRTDRGVSAAGNVIALTTETPVEHLVYSLQEKLQDIWITGVTTVDIDFNPRHAQQRWYRYFLPREYLDFEKMREASNILTGEHDFTNYAKIEEKNPRITIDSIMITPQDMFYCIDLKASYFLWHQVRRIIAALKQVGNHSVDLDEIHDSLNTPTVRYSFGNASPDYLILMGIYYTGLVFQNITVSHKKLRRLATHHRVRALMCDMTRETPKF